jgi:hypothetical protein
MAQQTAVYSIDDGNCFTVNQPNVIIDFGNAKLCFDKKQITTDELLDVYIKLQNYLNSFKGFYL